MLLVMVGIAALLRIALAFWRTPGGLVWNTAALGFGLGLCVGAVLVSGLWLIFSGYRSRRPLP